MNEKVLVKIVLQASSLQIQINRNYSIQKLLQFLANKKLLPPNLDNFQIQIKDNRGVVISPDQHIGERREISISLRKSRNIQQRQIPPKTEFVEKICQLIQQNKDEQLNNMRMRGILSTESLNLLKAVRKSQAKTENQRNIEQKIREEKVNKKNQAQIKAINSIISCIIDNEDSQTLLAQTKHLLSSQTINNLTQLQRKLKNQVILGTMEMKLNQMDGKNK